MERLKKGIPAISERDFEENKQILNQNYLKAVIFAPKAIKGGLDEFNFVFGDAIDR